MTLLDTLVQLVDTPSVIGNEGRICTTIAERLLAKYGQDGVARVGNSLVVGKRSGRPLVLIVGHIDTVPNQGQGQAAVDGERLVGLGTSDMKSGLAVMIHLLEDAEVLAGPYDVIGIFYDKEEGPSIDNGLEPVLTKLDWLNEATFAIVLEPTDLELQLGCLGTINATASFLGAPAHSARPWFGENAITKAGTWLADLHGRPPETISIAGLDFREVLSVTRASGGVANNVIPGQFDLNVNYRYAPDKTPEQAEARLHELVTRPDRVEIDDHSVAAPVPREHPLLDRLVAVTGAVVAPKQAWTDVARLTARGVPAVNFGPGETAQAHQPTESVPIANLDVAFDGLKAFLTHE